MAKLIFAIALGIGVFFICVYVTRWIFGINKIINHLKYQSYQLSIVQKMLCKMAAKEELTPDDVKKILETTSVQHLDD